MEYGDQELSFCDGAGHVRLLVCGDRHWTNEVLIRDYLAALSTDTVIVHGACRGADLLASRIAVEYGLSVEPHPADWQRLGRSAGPRRNQTMLQSGIDRVVAFHNDLQQSRGTRGVVLGALARGIPTDVIQEQSS